MKPYISSKNTINANVPYNLRISNKGNMIDQRRGLIELTPGYHTVVRVVPKVVETTEEFEKYDVTKRKCKLPYETDQFNMLKIYSKDGCELECAIDSALKICKCLPWYYPNNFTGTPICDMFGGKCFDMIMSDETNYKNCNKTCLEDCKGTTYISLPFKEEINIGNICREPLFKYFFKELNKRYENMHWFEHLTEGKWEGMYGNSDGTELCHDYVKKYISIVTVETPTSTVVKNIRDQAVTLPDWIILIGGFLGLFCGISILSLFEIIFFCLRINLLFCLSGKHLLWKTKLCEKNRDMENPSTLDVKKSSMQDKEKLNTPQTEVTGCPIYIEEFVTETIKRATKPLATEQSSFVKVGTRKSLIPRKLKSPIVHSI
jgi:hypothetical protein